MRFRQAHKSTTYAMALSSFLAVAFSGMLGPVTLFAALAGIIGSWFWEPPRINYQRWNLSWTIFAVLIFSYHFLLILAGAELLVTGAGFLAFLLVIKLFNRQESKDYLHIYILSFLMLTSGTVLNAEITYGLFFLCYVVSSTWALTIFHLRRELESNFLLRHSAGPKGGHSERVRVERVMNSKRIVGRKFFLGTSLVSLAVFLGAMTLFLVVPRIGFGLFFDKGRGGITMAGFSDGVELGGHGLIKSDTTVVMRVKVEGRYKGRAAPSLHWRGVAFDEYSKGQWRRSRAAPETERRIDFNTSTTIHHLVYDQKIGVNQESLDARKDAALRQEIYLEPLGYDVLFGASMPVALEVRTKWKNKTHAARNDELRHAHSTGIKYVVYSDPDPPKTSRLRAAPATLPKGYEVYLQIPDEVPDRVRELAEQITKGASTHYDKAKAIEQWLRTKLDYTLNMKSPGDQEPIDFFLFDRQKGHCEYFSSAMSIMARSVGVPTRNVNGFLGGEWNEYDDYIAVRAGDAHSWVEVYFRDVGWVTFDPTPSGTEQLGRGSAGFLDRMRRIADTMRFKWFKWVIEYDLYQQLKLFQGLGSAVKGGANRLFTEPLKRAKKWAGRHKIQAAAIAMVIGVFVIGLGFWRRKKSTPEIVRRRRRRDDPVVLQYLATLRLLAKRGHRRRESSTPREFARGLADARHPASQALLALTELYYQSEYGSSSPPDKVEAERLHAVVASELKRHKPT